MNLPLFFFGALLFVVSLFLMFLILIQRGKGGGLTGALGGMGGQSAFGSKAADAFTKVTVITSIIWIGLCMLTIAFFNRPPVAVKKPTMYEVENPYADSASGTLSAAGDNTEGGDVEGGGDANGETPEGGEGTGQLNMDALDGDAAAALPGLDGPDLSDAGTDGLEITSGGEATEMTEPAETTDPVEGTEPAEGTGAGESTEGAGGE